MTNRSDTLLGCSLAYVAKLTDEIHSEYGHVGIEPCCGGLRRTW